MALISVRLALSRVHLASSHESHAQESSYASDVTGSGEYLAFAERSYRSMVSAPARQLLAGVGSCASPTERAAAVLRGALATHVELFEPAGEPQSARYMIYVPHDGDCIPDELRALAPISGSALRTNAELERDHGCWAAAQELVGRVPGGIALRVRTARLWDANRTLAHGPNYESFLPADPRASGDLVVDPRQITPSIIARLGRSHYWPTHQALFCAMDLLRPTALVFELHSMDDYARGAARPATQVFVRARCGRVVSSPEVVGRVASALETAFASPCAVDEPHYAGFGLANFQSLFLAREHSKRWARRHWVVVELRKGLLGGVPNGSGCPTLVALPHNEGVDRLARVLSTTLEGPPG